MSMCLNFIKLSKLIHLKQMQIKILELTIWHFLIILCLICQTILKNLDIIQFNGILSWSS